MANFTRVLSKLDEYPSFEEMADLIRDEHPSCRLSIEEGDEEEWEILLLSGEENLEIALVGQRNGAFSSAPLARTKSRTSSEATFRIASPRVRRREWLQRLPRQ